MSQNSGMTKPKKSTDRHKPSRMVRVKGALAAQLDLIVAENETAFTDEVNRAIRELLVREGKWPPSKPKS